MRRKITGFVKNVFDSAATLGKVLLLSHRPFRAGGRKDKTLVILANGPSLRKALEQDMEKILSCPRLAVNFAACAPEFHELRPQYYVLADGHFFLGAEGDANVRKLWEILSGVEWSMTLYVPHKYRTQARALLGKSTIRLECFNLTPCEGLESVSHGLYDRGLAMPRPRNVLIPSIMIGMRMGYSKICLLGADHSWSRSLWVDDENRVVSVQPHFYREGSKEQARVNAEYAGYRLHDIMRSFYIAFRSYHQIEAYARSRGVEIINATPGSMIDAFARARF